MFKRVIVIFLVSFVFAAFIPLSMLKGGEQTHNPRVRHGVLDLSSWQQDQIDRMKLDGEWEFYWNQLLTPRDFKQANLTRPRYSTFQKVPSPWNGTIIDGKPLPAYGAATYRMVLKHLPNDGIFAIKKTNIRFSSTIYVNGQKLFEDGKPSLNPKTYLAGNIPQMAFFSAESGDVEIIVQVANFDYINAGIPVSLYFGEQTAMVQDQKATLAREFSTLAVLSFLAIIYFICYITASIYHKKDNVLLISAAICLLYALYHGLTGERTLFLFLPGFSFEALYKLKDMSSIASLILLAVFIYKSQKSIVSLKLIRAVMTVLGGFLVLVPFLPIRVYTTIQEFVILVYEILLVWLLWKAARGYIRSSTKANRLKQLLLYMAILNINLYSLDTILFAFSLKENLWVEQLYIIMFNVTMISLIILKFFEAYQTVDEMKNELLRLDRIKDDFLLNTSQQLKAPLNAIVNISDSLIQGVEGPIPKNQAQNLQAIVSSGRRLTYLVNELVDYSKIKHEDIVLFKSRLELRAVVDAVIRVQLYQLSGSQIRLINEVPDDHPPVLADSHRLIQVLHNLLGYAIRFSDYGVISVSSVVYHEQAQVTVKCAGSVIAAEQQERIIQTFQQLDDPEFHAEGGHGLGLTTTKKLIELHGGTLQIHADLGDGMSFVFTLPLAGPYPDRGPKEMAESNKHDDTAYRSDVVAYPLYFQGHRDETILVVENDFANLQAIYNLLKLEGYSVVMANRGQMALEELGKDMSFSLIILDKTLPDMTGYEWLNQIRARFNPFELPVLMLMDGSRVSDMKMSIECGANDFVGAPFEAEELMARVRSLTNLKASVKNAKDTEIAFLRSQINPHFLYNALNSIAELCVEAPGQAEELTLELSTYLRSSFDFKPLDSMTTLSSELQLVGAYATIEKARFGTRLEVEYEVDADPMLPMPPLILQPLVENAIRHGLMSNLKGGTVKVTVKEGTDSMVHFAVQDNGCGMSPQKRNELLQAGRNSKGVGFWNIRQRIQLLYGSSIAIESTVGVGTKVSFTIPGKSKATQAEQEASYAAGHDRGR